MTTNPQIIKSSSDGLGFNIDPTVITDVSADNTIKQEDKFYTLIDKIVGDLNNINENNFSNYFDSDKYNETMMGFHGLGNNKWLSDIDISIKKAMVENIVTSVDSDINRQIDTMYNAGINHIDVLNNIIKPQLELLQELQRAKKKVLLTRNDPDVQACVFRLDNTMQYIMQDLGPNIQSILNNFENRGVGMNMNSGMMNMAMAPRANNLNLGSIIASEGNNMGSLTGQRNLSMGMGHVGGGKRGTKKSNNHHITTIGF